MQTYKELMTMKITSTTKWLIWLQFFSAASFLISEVNGRRSCRKLLRNVKLPPHTKLASKHRKSNHVTLVCDKGYYFSKGKSMEDISCKSLKTLTNDRVPKCRGCGEPPGVKNGTVKFPATSVGSFAVYSCDVGFSLNGSRRQRKCRRNLRWSGGQSPIFCQKNKCRNPGNVTISNGNVTFSDRLFEEFSTISFQCNDGYELQGDEDIVCLQRQWSFKQRPICRKKRCPRPEIPEHGRTRHGSRLYIGSSVWFYCNSGFTLLGSRQRICQENKTWNGTVAVCDDGRSHCRNPGSPIGAIKTGRKYNEGDTVYYTCKDGLKLFQGSQNRTCLKNKTWSGAPPRCVDEDYKEFRPINETAQLFREGFVNSLLQTTCTGTNVSCPKRDARARALNLKYKGGLDLIFVLDTSSSIRKDNFDIAKEFVKKIVEIFGVDKRKNGDGTHIACVTYGTQAQLEFTFNDASVQTKEDALKRIDKIKYTRGATATRLALDMVRKVVLPSTKRNSTKALFLVTDGESNVGGSPKKVVDILKKTVEIYVIGIGKKVKDASLRSLASKEENVFPIRNYKELNKIKKKIVSLPVKDYSECGTSPFKPHDARARIVGGKKTDSRNWPWAVAIFYQGQQECGGTFINLEFILTAAHCFNKHGTSPSDVVVSFQDKKRTVHTSLAVHIHPNYNSDTYVNDIALVKIPKLKRFTKNQQAICLPRKVNITNIYKPGNSMYSVGWGTTKHVKRGEFGLAEDMSKDLKEVKLPFQANKFCADNVKNKTDQGLKNWYFNSNTQFCAGDLTGHNDTCQGDSGGPAMVLQKHPVSGKWRWFQVGIVSWGYGCAQLGEVGYYTKVSAYVTEWIDKITKSNSS